MTNVLRIIIALCYVTLFKVNVVLYNILKRKLVEKEKKKILFLENINYTYINMQKSMKIDQICTFSLKPTKYAKSAFLILYF